jgi:tRNA threonylcarbamoyladenosine biosynthesis protein TsaE
MNASGSNLEIFSPTARRTRILGRQIGERLQNGLVIRLSGDLGSGKTCFVQGLAQGLAVPPGYGISSPTYTLIHEYPGRLPLAHVDLYRLSDEMDAEAIGLLDLITPATVVAVEWADRLPDAFWPAESLKIAFQFLPDETRCIQLFGYGLQIGNLIKEIRALWDIAPEKPSSP